MESREAWDRAARDYQQTFRLGVNEYNRALLAFWEERGMLRPGLRVLDVGCGVGKYGVELARRGCDVTLTDISPEMLRLAAENMAETGAPWRGVCCDFRAADPQAPPFAEGFDLVMATMTPAVRDREDVERFAAMSRGWCFLARFAAWEQRTRDDVLRRAGLRPRPAFPDLEGENAALLSAVRGAGFAPETRLVPYGWEDRRSPEETADYLCRRALEPGEAGPETRERLRKAAAELTGPEGLVRDAVETRALWIWWTVKRGEGA